ncbi:MAG: PEP-utilizing enzyme [Candidatus Moraniibacteriota bacterium]
MQQINKNKYKVMRSRKVLPFPVDWNGKSQVSSGVKKIHQIPTINLWYYFDGGNVAGFYLEKEWNSIEKSVSNRMVEDEEYVPLVYELQKQKGKFLVSLSQKIQKLKLHNFNLIQLMAEYEKLENAWIDFDHVNVTPWFVGGDSFQAQLKDKLKALNISENEVDALLIPNKLSFSAEEGLGILKIALNLTRKEQSKKESVISIEDRKAIDVMVKKYYWIPFGYDGPDLYDAEHYIEAVRDIMKKMKSQVIKQKIEKIEKYSSDMEEKQKKLFSKYKLSKELTRQIGIIHVLAEMTDERKSYAFPAHIAFQEIIKNMALILNCNQLVLRHITLEEIDKYQKFPKKIIKLGEARINKPLLFHHYDGKLDIFTGSKAKKMFEKVTNEIADSDGSTLKGNIGSKGSSPIIRGIVRILNTPQEMERLKDGEILITAMTTPEYVPAMRRSLAIITDEGGVTCHAAIVSRELGKPCIIGTKIATKFLKNGELIEMDMEKGTIKKLAE